MVAVYPFPAINDAGISAWDIAVPILAGLIIALWPSRHGVDSFGRTFGLSAALSFFIYALSLAVNYVLTLVSAIGAAGLTAIGILSDTSEDRVMKFALDIVAPLVIIVPQLVYIFRAIRKKRRGGLEL